jgi:hypothetical protein
VKSHYEPESEAELVERFIGVIKLTAAGSWPWLADLRAAGQRRGVQFLQIVTYFDAHPHLLERFLAESAAGRAESAIRDVLNGIMA